MENCALLKNKHFAIEKKVQLLKNSLLLKKISSLLEKIV